MPKISLPLHPVPWRMAVLAATPLLTISLLAQSTAPVAQTAATPAKSTADTPAAATPTTIKVNVKAVTMAVTVRDKHDAIVPNLTRDDFTLQEDNRPQTISYFTHDTNLPLNLGLLVDTSGSQRNALDDERTASEHFLDQMITDAKDKAFLIQFDREVDLLVDLTSDKGKLRSAVDKLGTPQFQNNNGDQNDQNGNSGRRGGGGGTQLYDSIYLASDELMQKQPGRKALILLTDGVDRGSKESINGALEAAQRADTAIYAIYFKGEEDHDNNNGNHRGLGHGGGFPGGGGGGYPGGGGGYPGGGGGYPGGGNGGGQDGGRGRPTNPHVDGKKILERICGETGGRMFEVTKKDNVDAIYSKIAEELRSQYILSYTPDKQSNDNSFHRITLTGKKKDWIVQTRAGYYAGQPE